ncbi:hypothetical protein QUF72_11590 [Desulfobacterales bacterium HSG2]|nr:hypothetical protein [Desulfobacterales bacterium HSG2]
MSRSGSVNLWAMVRDNVTGLIWEVRNYDPDNRMLTPGPPSRLVRKNFADCLRGLGKKAGALTVLKPLGLSDIKKNREKLPELVPQWEEEIRSLDLSDHETRELTELLIYAVVQRFQKLTLKEVEKMIQLTPIDQTVVGQELIQMGIEKGEREMREKTARNLLSMGKLTAKEISQVTGLKVKEIQALLKKETGTKTN